MEEKGLKPLRSALKKSLEAATSAAEKNLHLAEEWLEARAIDLPTAIDHRLGVVVDQIPGQTDGLVGRLAIPFLGPSGPVFVQYRCLAHEDCKSSGQCTKFLGWSGAGSRLFNTRALLQTGTDIYVTEGPLDALVLSGMGLLSVGVPGSQKWEPWWPRVFAGFSRVFVLGDGDQAGRDFNNKFLRELDQAVAVPMRDGMDVNSVVVEQGHEALLSLIREADAED